MILKINRQDCINKFPVFPLREYNAMENEFIDYYPKTFAGYILTLSAKSYIGHFKLLGTELTNMTIYMGEKELIFLGDIKTPWLSRDHDFKPAKEGLQYLVDNKIGKKFNGALLVDITQLSTFITHLAWLVRCNAIAPYIHFIDPGQNIIGSICQYGNLHIFTRNKKADNLFKKVIQKTKLENSIDGRCYNKYTKSSAIKGRSMI